MTIRVLTSCFVAALTLCVPPSIASNASNAEEKVQLGEGTLTSGIAGKGPLTLPQVQAWLANPKNHEVLEVALPEGLAAASDTIYIPEDNPLTRAKIELGRQLYFDRRLSSGAEVSCADCHHPNHGYAKDTQFGVGVGKQTGNRNSPVAYNRIISKAQFWDGRAASLEEQAKGPIANPIEMANTHDAAVSFLSKNPVYRAQFEKIFGRAVNIDDAAKAMASFERVLVSGPSPYDAAEPLRKLEETFADELDDLEAFKADYPNEFTRYLAAKRKAQQNPLSDSAKRGRDLFFNEKSNCTACHMGANFTDEKYHNLGVGMEKSEPDLGRYEVTKVEADKGAFKTPTLRNVEFSAPYMHDGSQATLEEVIEWYAKGGHPNPHLSEKVRKLDLTKQDKADLVAFMKALTGSFPRVIEDRLPQ